jgi:hypothetical protein
LNDTYSKDPQKNTPCLITYAAMAYFKNSLKGVPGYYEIHAFALTVKQGHLMKQKYGKSVNDT